MARTALAEIVATHIRQNGPMDVGAYMSMALSHPEHGYYMKKDPFGVDGDFITAPEVSQMFGEMIGAWIVDVWHQMGEPAAFTLVECGAGRGTLMADILRVASKVGGFIEAMDLCMLEISPVLKAKQASALEGYGARWCENLSALSDDKPMIVIGNEFLDALPFRSLQKSLNGWVERVVAQGDDGGLQFGVRPVGAEITAHIPFHVKDAAVSSVYEISPARQDFVGQVAQRLKAQGGAALFIDYGHIKSAAGNTFQAVRRNEFSDVLADVGDADLTSHVDFDALTGSVCGCVRRDGPVTQGEFLKALGIELRAQMLKSKASGQNADMIEKGLHRLVSSDQMGSLFKVIALSVFNGKTIEPCGF